LTAERGVLRMYGNPTFDCNGVQIRALCRQLAVAAAVSGEINAANVDQVSRHLRRFILAEKPFVLDLTDVTSFTSEGVSLLDFIDGACEAADVKWSVIPSRAVSRVLRMERIIVPTASSVPDALDNFAEAMVARRQLLPLLTKSA
jgi:anti-anti-sigma factor